MCAEKGRDASQRLYVPDHSQQFIFLIRRETITGFRFNSRRAVSEKPLHVLCCRIKQGIFGGSSSLTDGGSDAAACSSNLGVAGAARALLELIGAVSREYRMCVRVHKSG